jgi:hypothetical protein
MSDPRDRFVADVRDRTWPIASVARGTTHAVRAGLPGLPARLELEVESSRQVIVGIATRIAGPVEPGGWESWDLTVCGEAFEPLAVDPFSFAGDFLDDGVTALTDTLLDPAGFGYEFDWVSSFRASGYHAAIHLLA